MAAPVGNQFWKMRSKHGRELIFTSPQLLWEAAKEYFEWCDQSPWYRHDFVGKDAVEVWKETARPYTISGLCVFLDCDDELLDNYEKKEDFSEVVTRIRRIIYTQKFEGAAVGAFNPSIIARDLGLVDKSDLTSKGAKIGSPDLSKFNDEDLAELARLQQKMSGE